MLVKKRFIYFGLNLTHYPQKEDIEIIHIPLIKIVPRPFEKIKNELKQFEQFTHLIITSKSTVPLLIKNLLLLGFSLTNLKNKVTLAVGDATSKELSSYGIPPQITAKEETSEGIVLELQNLSLIDAQLFWPHSSLSRRVISDYCRSQHLSLTECLMYDTLPLELPPTLNLQEFEGVIFTSPSTIDAFLEASPFIPQHLEMKTVGKITEAYLKSKLA